jgi:hypothetical protein
MMWVLALVVLLVVFPVGSIARIRDAARAGSQDLDAVPLLLTTQRQVKETVENVAAYGGSLDVILDDAR